MGGYTRKTWVNGVDAVSAENMNNIEDGLSRLWSQERDLADETDSLTLDLSHAGQLVEVDKATAVNVTVPPDSDVDFPLGTQIELVQAGAGAVTVVAGSGVTVHKGAALTLTINGQWVGATLYKRGSDEWVLVGNLVPA